HLYSFPSLLFCLTSRRWLGPQRTTGVRPLERLGEHPIEVSDEVQQFITQIFHRCERTTPDHLPHDHPEDRFDLVQPRTVLGRIHEPNPLALLPTRTPAGSPPISAPHTLPSSPTAARSRTPGPPSAPTSPSNGCSNYPLRKSTRPSGRWPPSARCGWRSPPPSASGQSSERSTPRSSPGS